MKTIVIVIAATMLSGCAATKEERDAAKIAWTECIMRKITQLDDGKSDPLSIAYGVAPACAVHYEAMTQGVVREMITEGGQDYMRNKMHENELRLVTEAVLFHRASRTRR
jgi:hypothetical protein